GHHVIINHVGLRILYGHLGIIAVKEGDVVSPGTIVALSSDTGRSTGPHLHIRAERLIDNEWKSVDPEPFINHLNDYICGLQEEIANLRFESRPDKPLNLHNLFKVMENCGVLYPKIVAAQYCLETGYGTSNVCRNYNNLFGLYNSSTHDYYRFRSWEESVAGYVRMIQRRYDPKKDKDYYAFLKRIGYAENMDSYNAKVRAIANTL
ncbi:MAG: glucosaminidase domain-containing protein, partial [Aeriscardovia sp.]|nr:glucosaminidase domain-containing protein [Aeriscardovia sp.]